MADFVIEKNTLKAYEGTDAHVVIPDGITTIAGRAFKNCKELKSVVIPKGVKSIGNEAFKDCKKLKDVTIPQTVKRIGFRAFDKTPWQKKQGDFVIVNNILLRYQGEGEDVVIPDHVTSICDRAFYECRHVESVIIPKSVTEIGNKTFWYCIRLKKVLLPDSMTKIHTSAFGNCWNLKRVVLPHGVTSLGDGAFDVDYKFKAALPKTIICMEYFPASWKESLLSPPSGTYTVSDGALEKYEGNEQYVYIPDDVTRIGENAFAGCKDVLNIVVPSGVTHIEAGAFANCPDLISVSIPKSVVSIGDGAFSGCENLMHIVLPENLKIISKDMFKDCCSLWYIDLPKGLKSIGDGAFRNCESLKVLSLPETVERIGAEAFSGCSMISEMAIPDGISAIGRNAFEGTDINVIALPGYIADSVPMGLHPSVRIIRTSGSQKPAGEEASVNIDWLPGWRCVPVDVELYLYKNGKRQSSSLEYPRGYSAFRGPACLVEQLKEGLGEGVKTESFSNGIAQIFFESEDTESIGNDFLAEFASLKFACFDSGYCQCAVYSESGDPSITFLYELDYEEDEGQHWTYRANVLKDGEHRYLGSRIDTAGPSNYRFPFAKQWTKDEYIIRENGQYYLCTPEDKQ